jgi:hypothetical protein
MAKKKTTQAPVLRQADHNHRAGRINRRAVAGDCHGCDRIRAGAARAPGLLQRHR